MNTEASSSHGPEAKQPVFVGLTFKQRLLPSILLALAAALSVCFFGPFDIYGNNLGEFAFSLTDFLGWSLLFTLLGCAVLLAILLPLRGRVFDLVYAVLLWLTVMLFVQGNYLNAGISSLAGDGVGDGDIGIISYVINTAVWVLLGIAILLAVWFFASKYRDTLQTVVTVALIAVIGMQAVSFLVLSLTTDVWSDKYTEDTHFTENKSILTYANMDKVSTNKNIIYFVVDRFDVEYYEDYGLVNCPELFEELDGFTYFDDMVSMYPRTFPSVPYMLTGIEHDFHDARLDYFKDAYTKAPFLKELKKNNYRINIYTDDYYSYADAGCMGEYVKNSSATNSYKIENAPRLSVDMLRLSLFRYLPLVAKTWTGDISTSTFEQYVEYNTPYPDYTTDMKDAYEFLRDHPLSAVSGANNFSFIHFSGCHMPNLYDENFDEVSLEDRNNPVVALKQSFAIINLYLKQLKELGLYEDATIIIAGDHANIRRDSEFRGPFTTALFFKPSGSAGTELQVNHAPVAQGDIIPSILASEGIQTTQDFGKTLFDFQEGDVRERTHVFQRREEQVDGPAIYEVIVFCIVGNSRDLKNWEIVSEGDWVGSIYQ